MRVAEGGLEVSHDSPAFLAIVAEMVHQVVQSSQVEGSIEGKWH